MGDPRGFLTTTREAPTRRPVDLRLMDWREVYEEFPDQKLEKQAGRCMNCGIPFCHQGCPLGNLIPEWNDLVYRDEWREAIERLHATNNFPEFTGTLCPAPCEAACVLAINSDAVTIKQVELQIVDHAWREGWVVPQPRAGEDRARRSRSSGRARRAWPPRSSSPASGTTSRCSNGPTGSAGCCATASPSSRWRSSVWTGASPRWRPRAPCSGRRTNVGTDVTVEQLKTEFDAVVLAGGATAARDLPAPGREFTGIYQAMEYLPWANRVQQGDLDEPPITAEGKHVVIVGGGDTGADCLGTAHRQGAASVTQLEIMPTPPEKRTENMPWPTYPMVYRVASAHEEGGERLLRGEHRRVHRRRRRQRRDAAARGGHPRRRTAGSSPWRAPSTRSRRSWCSSRWASSARRRARCSRAWAWTSTRAATSRATGTS